MEDLIAEIEMLCDKITDAAQECADFETLQDLRDSLRTVDIPTEV